MKYLTVFFFVNLFLFYNQVSALELRETLKTNTGTGQIIEKSFYTNNRIGVDENGVRKIREKYNLDGLLVEKSFFGRNNKLIINKKIGAAKITYSHNNEFISLYYFGIKGEKIKNIEGCATIIYFINDNKITGKSCYPTLADKYGYSTIWIDLNGLNDDKCVQQTTKGLDGRVIKDKNGFYAYNQCINTENNLTSFYFYSNLKPDGNPAYGLDKNGVAWYNFFYGNSSISRSNNGIDLKMINDKNGFSNYWFIITDPNDKGVYTQAFHFRDKDGNKKNDKYGIAQYSYVYKNKKLDTVRCQESSGNYIQCPTGVDSELFIKNLSELINITDQFKGYINRPTIEQIYSL